MHNIRPKLRAIFYAVMIEGVVLLFSTRISAGPCGPTDGFSAVMLLFTFVFHLPGLIMGAPLYVLLSYLLPSPWNTSALGISTVAGNFLFLSWLIYTIRKIRSEFYS
jgi:hypothetical protein